METMNMTTAHFELTHAPSYDVTSRPRRRDAIDPFGAKRAGLGGDRLAIALDSAPGRSPV
ncbi:hypothetical protein [Xylanimonas ulmi]|uniref:Uncharacterized protein n=1 Tax=Xylanimonas ulmi TaxID=228973 RepID=A0A4Q7LXN6_9MICO|nr:hypothetical protein [Xylanibacterium ulmi]RZS59776.1 hypothetical protein EV386_0007 [Xylanibacterium ulmi]